MFTVTRIFVVAALAMSLAGCGRSWETRKERRLIIISCMQQRGHKVVG